MAKRKNLKAYVRLDANKKPIGGSMILRQQKPYGNFAEMTNPYVDICCTPIPRPPVPECITGDDYTYIQTSGGIISDNGELLATDFYSDTFDNIPIGFTFNFQNVDYTELSIGSYGQITFKIPGGYCPNEYGYIIPTASALDLGGGPTVFALALSQYYETSDRPDAGIYTQLTGEPGSRVFSIIFKSVLDINAYCTYQINLFEGTNQISMMYGDLADWVYYNSAWPMIGMQGYDLAYPGTPAIPEVPFSVKLDNTPNNLSNTTLFWSPSCTPFQAPIWDDCQCYNVSADDNSDFQYVYYYSCGTVAYYSTNGIGTVCGISDPRLAPQAYGTAVITLDNECPPCIPLTCSCYEVQNVGVGPVNTNYSWCDGGGGGMGGYSAGASTWKDWYCAIQYDTNNPSAIQVTNLGSAEGCGDCWKEYYPSAQLKCYKIENVVKIGIFRVKFIPKNAPPANSHYSYAYYADFTSPDGPLPDIYFCAYDILTPVIENGSGTIVALGTSCNCSVVYQNAFSNYVDLPSCPACLP